VKRSGYSVFVTYRKRRLTLKRGLPTLEAAARFTEELKRSRFHERDDIIIVDERSGETVVLPTAEAPARAPDPAETDARLRLIAQALEQAERAFRKLARVRRELRGTAELLGMGRGERDVLAEAGEDQGHVAPRPSGLRKARPLESVREERAASEPIEHLLEVAER
jgi:hypothetical protein